MKKTFFAALAFAIAAPLFAQDAKTEGFNFTVVKENPITSIKNQNNSGTCWAYSSLGFFESELLRMGKDGSWKQTFSGRELDGCTAVCPAGSKVYLGAAGSASLLSARV